MTPFTAAPVSEIGGIGRDGSIGNDGSIGKDGSIGRDGGIERDVMEEQGGTFVVVPHEDETILLKANSI